MVKSHMKVDDHSSVHLMIVIFSMHKIRHQHLVSCHQRIRSLTSVINIDLTVSCSQRFFSGENRL